MPTRKDSETCLSWESSKTLVEFENKKRKQKEKISSAFICCVEKKSRKLKISLKSLKNKEAELWLTELHQSSLERY